MNQLFSSAGLRLENQVAGVSEYHRKAAISLTKQEAARLADG
jgi:hypothetical protein